MKHPMLTKLATLAAGVAVTLVTLPAQALVFSSALLSSATLIGVDAGINNGDRKITYQFSLNFNFVDTNGKSDSRAPFQFALIGDSPYNVGAGESYPPFDRLITSINSDKSLSWILHAGDIKGGSTPCTDELFQDRLDRYNEFQQPVILTLGDNEWTDCHRVKAGSYQPLERLAKLREMFYPEPGTVSIGQNTLTVNVNDTAYPENVWWQKNGIYFSAIHVVGSKNGLAPFQEGSQATRTAADDQEVADRTQAGVELLNAVFEKAEADDAAGIMIMIHANPELGAYINGEEEREGFVEFLTALEANVREFAKPVALLHGDSHYFRIDKPNLMSSDFLANFTRVESFGSSVVNWVKVNVDPKSKKVFDFEVELVEGNNTL